MCGSRVAVANAEHRLGHDVLRDRAEKLLRRLVLLARPLVPRLRRVRERGWWHRGCGGRGGRADSCGYVTLRAMLR